MLLSGKPPIVNFQMTYSNAFVENKTHIKSPNSRRAFSHFMVKLVLATAAFVVIGITGIVNLEKI